VTDRLVGEGGCVGLKLDLNLRKMTEQHPAAAHAPCGWPTTRLYQNHAGVPVVPLCSWEPVRWPKGSAYGSAKGGLIRLRGMAATRRSSGPSYPGSRLGGQLRLWASSPNLLNWASVRSVEKISQDAINSGNHRSQDETIETKMAMPPSVEMSTR
jgi:hypothetical protein